MNDFNHEGLFKKNVIWLVVLAAIVIFGKHYQPNNILFKKNVIWLVVLAAIVIFGFLLFKGWDKVVNDEIDGMITITGNFSCLPFREGIKMSETCALGVRGRDGLHYALDI